MNNAINEGTSVLSVDEYIRLEQQSVHRHECVNGQLKEMTEEKGHK